MEYYLETLRATCCKKLFQLNAEDEQFRAENLEKTLWAILNTFEKPTESFVAVAQYIFINFHLFALNLHLLLNLCNIF